MAKGAIVYIVKLFFRGDKTQKKMKRGGGGQRTCLSTTSKLGVLSLRELPIPISQGWMNGL